MRFLPIACCFLRLATLFSEEDLFYENGTEIADELQSSAWEESYHTFSSRIAELPVMEIRGGSSPVEKKQLDFVIHLTDPTFSQGVLMTEKGGVVTAEGFRIQAQKIEYSDMVENGVPIKKIVAEGDLMMEYGGQAFVGRRLEFDLLHKTGILWDGKTYVDFWFLGGEKIVLLEDETYCIYNAYVTTCESQDSMWEISTSSAQITKKNFLSARDVKFKFFKIPVFWIPSFKANLKWIRDPPIRYKIKWDRKLGPRISMRYKFYSWEGFKAYLRLDYRIEKGPGLALETDYHSKDNTTLLRTKSYGAYDKEVPNENGPRRYRLQGLYQTQSNDGRSRAYLCYDKLSDEKMIQDFKSEDFEVNTQQRTILTLYHQEDRGFVDFKLQPSINRFQSLNQELPLTSIGIRPFQIGSSGIMMENHVSAGYLHYTYARSLREILPNRHALRLETDQRLYRPLTFSHITLTPQIGLAAIFYNNNQKRDSVGQAVFTYGGEAQTHLSRTYSRYKHMLEPYISYEGYTHPTANPSHYLVFSIDDGYFQFNAFRAGIRNTFFSKKHFDFSPRWTVDLYSYAFIKANSTHQTFPKLYADIAWLQSSYEIRLGAAYNLEQHLVDYANLRSEVTVSENIAFALEYRHRSRYDWRKANRESFIVDVARSLENLLDSPLSDRRSTFLTRLKVRFSPRVTCYIQSHHGWDRDTEPVYHEAKLDIHVLFTAGWYLRLGLEKIPGDFRQTIGFTLNEF